MNAGKENIEERLQEFLDSRGRKEGANKLINETDELKQDLGYIHETDSILRNIPNQGPSYGFSDRVMKKLAEEPAAKSIRRQGLIIFLGVILVLMITAFFFNSMNTSIALPEDVSVVGQNFSLDGIGGTINMDLIIKGLMFVSFFLAMILFDLTILRPLFQKRKNFS